MTHNQAKDTRYDNLEAQLAQQNEIYSKEIKELKN